MSLFGWDYPPGCSSVPGDEPEAPCVLCGNEADDCTCPECPTCSTIGCIEHLPTRELLSRYERSSYLFHAQKAEIERRNALLPAVECGKCKAKLADDIRREDPLWCPSCQTWEWDWFNPSEERR